MGGVFFAALAILVILHLFGSIDLISLCQIVLGLAD